MLKTKQINKFYLKKKTNLKAQTQKSIIETNNTDGHVTRLTKELTRKKNVDANFKTNMNLPKLDNNTFQSNEND